MAFWMTVKRQDVELSQKNVAIDNSDGVTWKAANISDQLSVTSDF